MIPSKLRIIGFSLIGLAVVGALLAFTQVEGYRSNLGFIQNLGRAEVFRKTETVTETRKCSNPWREYTLRLSDWHPQYSGSQEVLEQVLFSDRELERGCSRTSSDYGTSWRPLSMDSALWPTYTVTRVVVTPGIPLGRVLAGLVALGLVGMGLVVFTPRG